MNFFFAKTGPFSSICFLYVISLGIASYTVIISYFNCLNLLMTESHLKGFLDLLDMKGTSCTPSIFLTNNGTEVCDLHTQKEPFFPMSVSALHCIVSPVAETSIFLSGG